MPKCRTKKSKPQIKVHRYYISFTISIRFFKQASSASSYGMSYSNINIPNLSSVEIFLGACDVIDIGVYVGLIKQILFGKSWISVIYLFSGTGLSIPVAPILSSELTALMWNGSQVGSRDLGTMA